MLSYPVSVLPDPSFYFPTGKCGISYALRVLVPSCILETETGCSQDVDGKSVALGSVIGWLLVAPATLLLPTLPWGWGSIDVWDFALWDEAQLMKGTSGGLERCRQAGQPGTWYLKEKAVWNGKSVCLLIYLNVVTVSQSLLELTHSSWQASVCRASPLSQSTPHLFFPWNCVWVMAKGSKRSRNCDRPRLDAQWCAAYASLLCVLSLISEVHLKDVTFRIFGIESLIFVCPS